MPARTTQVVAEVLMTGHPAARTTQVVAEALIGAAIINARTTQVVAEVLIAPDVSADTCALPWVMPQPNAYPFPAQGGPQYSYFEELTPGWGEYGKKFGDGVEGNNTFQTAKVRHFAVEYVGLLQSEARQLDAHYESTRGGIGFTMTHPRTGEVISGVRYEEYRRGPHVKTWIQLRSVRLVKHAN